MFSLVKLAPFIAIASLANAEAITSAEFINDPVESSLDEDCILGWGHGGFGGGYTTIGGGSGGEQEGFTSYFTSYFTRTVSDGTTAYLTEPGATRTVMGAPHAGVTTLYTKETNVVTVYGNGAQTGKGTAYTTSSFTITL